MHYMTSSAVSYKTVKPDQVTTWHPACSIDEFPADGGLCFSLRGLQIAVFNFARRNEWFATQNLCPHKKQMILSRGLIGSEGPEPKVACPFHKKTFSLKTGENLNGSECQLATYPVKVENDMVYIGLSD